MSEQEISIDHGYCQFLGNLHLSIRSIRKAIHMIDRKNRKRERLTLMLNWLHTRMHLPIYHCQKNELKEHQFLGYMLKPDKPTKKQLKMQAE